MVLRQCNRSKIRYTSWHVILTLHHSVNISLFKDLNNRWQYINITIPYSSRRQILPKSIRCVQPRVTDAITEKCSNIFRILRHSRSSDQRGNQIDETLRHPDILGIYKIFWLGTSLFPIVGEKETARMFHGSDNFLYAWIPHWNCHIPLSQSKVWKREKRLIQLCDVTLWQDVRRSLTWSI